MNRPPKTYALTLAQIETLSDAICHLDGVKNYFIADADDVSALVKDCHHALVSALGADAYLVYGQDEESRPA